MTKEQKLHSLIYDLRKQYPIGGGVSTYNRCSNKCGNNVRGAGLCAVCIEKEIAELIGSTTIAMDIHEVTSRTRHVINEALELATEKAG